MADTLVDSYSESNQNSNALPVAPGAGFRHREGQGFTGNGGKLTSCSFYLTRADVLSGNCGAYLYALSGTFGSNKTIPTGSVLATATPVSASTLSLTPTYTLISFTFDGTYTLTSGSLYFITCDYLGPISYMRVGINNGAAGPPPIGNYAYYDDTAAWHSVNNPMCFYVYSTAPVTTSILKVAGVPQASISKICGVSMANVKKVAGVANS
jgi:hypothetical protein